MFAQLRALNLQKKSLATVHTFHYNEVLNRFQNISEEAALYKTGKDVKNLPKMYVQKWPNSELIKMITPEERKQLTFPVKSLAQPASFRALLN